jgi:hypothetical protein
MVNGPVGGGVTDCEESQATTKVAAASAVKASDLFMWVCR